MTVLELAARATERIDERSRDLKPRVVALTLIALIPFCVAFVIFFAWKIVWTVISWLWAAGLEGWETAKSLNTKDG